MTTAPSWWWASVTGHIKYHHLHPEEKEDDFKTNLRVLDCRIDPQEPHITVSSCSGVLTLQGVYNKAEPCIWDEEFEYPLVYWGAPESSVDDLDRIGEERHELNELLARQFPFAASPEYTNAIEGIRRPDTFRLPSGEDDFSTMDYDLNISRRHGTIHRYVADDFGELSRPAKGHSLRDPVTEIQVGFWAPDVIESSHSGDTTPNTLTFLALGKIKKYVFAMGLVPAASGSSQYRRVGLGIWDFLAWHNTGEARGQAVFEIV
jgi:hypothetical protein